MLSRKLARALLRRPGQGLALVLVFALAAAAFTGIRGAYVGISAGTERAYRELGLPDLLARVTFAPRSAVGELEGLEGVAAVVPRIDVDTTAVGHPGVRVHVLSVPILTPTLGRVRVVRGRALSGRPGEALVAEAAAAPHGLGAGDAVVLRDGDGGARTLRIVGVARQPEHLSMIAPNGYMATPGSFLVLYLPEIEARDLLGRGGGATEFEIAVVPGANVAAVASRVKRALRTYGGSVTPASELDSVRNIRVHLEALAAAALVFPLFFLLAGAMGGYVLLGRLVREERGFIGLMRAQGIGAGAMAGHYLAYAATVALFGTALGLPIAVPLAGAVRAIFAADLGVPATGASIDSRLAVGAALVTLASALAGAAAPALRVARLRPAEALRPAVRAGPRWLPAGSGTGRSGVMARLVLRGGLRDPTRVVLTTLGVGMAVALAVAPALMLREMGRVEAGIADVRAYDLRVVPKGVEGEAWVAGLATMDGVIAAEPVLELPITLEGDGVSVDTYAVGLASGSRLLRLPVPPPGTALLARGLPAVGSRPTLVGPVGSVRLAYGGRVDYPLARPVIVSLGDAQRLVALPEGARRLLGRVLGPGLLGVPPVSSALLRVAPGQAEEVARRISAMAGVVRVDTAEVEREDLRRILRLSRAFIGIVEVFALLLALSLSYTMVAVSAAERRAEFGALRMLGMRALEVGTMFAAEMALTAALGWAVGVPAGWGVARAALGGFPDFLPAGVPLDALTLAAAGMGAVIVAVAATTPTVWGLARANLSGVAREGAL